MNYYEPLCTENCGDLVRCYHFLIDGETLKERATELNRSMSGALLTQYLRFVCESKVWILRIALVTRSVEQHGSAFIMEEEWGGER